ncbi:podocalyxin [Neophocaena asiaeorientalis asiaeorientalis]|uniref:Podocalyxin n=1 Tax=Neophocaena asiaeorientalis asiaeorientalis TaxID=1706337 RepID=A0A341AT87_NEOAA|nr:podocalyxin [Neophocaena asiaeorientalis asiaeorientalis]
MRFALVLSAFLLLPPLSLSQDEVKPSGQTAAEDSKPDTLPPSSVQDTVKQSTVPPSTDKNVIALETNRSTPTTPNTSRAVPTSTQQSTTAAASGKDEKPATGSPAITTKDSKDSTTAPTTVSTKPETTSSQSGIKSNSAKSGTQSSHSVTTSSVITKEGNRAASDLPNPVNTSVITPALPSVPTPASTHRPSTVPVTLVPVTSEPSGSSEGPNKITAATSLGTMAGPTFTTQGTLTTLTPWVTSQGTQHTSSKTPAVTGTSEALQPTGSSSGPGTTSPARGPTSSNTHLESTVPQGSSIPSPTSVIPVGVGQIQCDSPEKLNEKMLVLNVSKTDVSKTNICNATASNDKLITLLCRAAKASFNPAQDQCHIQLAPVPEIQAVAIKQITICTKLFPTTPCAGTDWPGTCFLPCNFLLPGQVGVNDMQFEGQGPPEETEDRFSMPLIITIVCMASFLLLVAALYGCCHQRLSQRKDQQRLTEELQTVENGYHDNPTLEVMETSSEMQEKKVVSLNGELGDSWIVPLDNLTKDDLEEEEDTHL